MTEPESRFNRASRQESAEQLRAIGRELEGELAAVQARMSAITGEAAAVEARAMSAIKRKDDRAARAALIEQGRLMTEYAEFDADAKVLRSLLDEIREFLIEHSETGPVR